MKNNYFWIGFYFNQSCILHPATGRWTLTGYFDNQVVCRRNIGTPEEDSMIYQVEEIQFVLKKINPFLFASMQNFHWWIKTMATSGYWMNFDEQTNVIYEG